MKHTSLFLKASSCLSFALLLACPAGMQAGNVPGEPVAPPCSLPAGIIRFNQVGYYPNQEKVVTVNEGAVESFALVDAATGRTVFSGKPSYTATSAWSDKVRWVTRYLDDVFHKRMVITHCKNLCKGHQLRKSIS